MASAVRDAYAGLFELYGDAHRKDDEAIRNWMRTRAPQASPKTIDRSLASFHGVCKLAEFGADANGQSDTSTVGAGAATTEVPPQAIVKLGDAAIPVVGPSVHINVELHLPASATAADYEAFFAAMRKYLFDGSPAAG